MDPYAPVPRPSDKAIKWAEHMYGELKSKSSAYVERFEERYNAWKKTWFKDNNSPNAANRAEGPEWSALVSLGPKIVPLVVYKLANKHDFMAVLLCMAFKYLTYENTST